MRNINTQNQTREVAWATPQDSLSELKPMRRIQLIWIILLGVSAIFVVRLFYLQIIRHDYYLRAAHSDQFREYDVIPERGIISANLGDSTVPIVANQNLYTVFGDPTLIKDTDKTATAVAPLLGLDINDVKTMLARTDTSYVVLKKQVTAAVNTKVLDLKLPGIASQVQSYRIYPLGSTLAQVLGFVDNEGDGVYGIEQAQNDELKGRVGSLKAITDVNGIPLPASNDNFSVQPVAGKGIDLTIDLGMQTQVEEMVKATQKEFNSKSVSAIVMETKTGAIKAMANYPTFSPANYEKVQDASLFQNNAATLAREPGSITKTLSIAAAIDTGAIRPDVTFYDPGKWVIDGSTILDVEEDKAVGTQNLVRTLRLSLNTGAVWALMQMGGGQINAQARNTLYDYYSNHFHLGQPTGIEQGYEATGYLPGPKDTGSGIDLTYANLAFGQAYTASALQMLAAFNGIIDGGIYYQPRLIENYVLPDGTKEAVAPKKLEPRVVSEATSKAMVKILDDVTKLRVSSGVHTVNFGTQYIAGTKSGTAQVANPNGGYLENVHDGTYLGFIGGDEPQYTVIVYNIEPKIPSDVFAGAYSAQPLFAQIIRMLINNYGVVPKSH